MKGDFMSKYKVTVGGRDTSTGEHINKTYVVSADSRSEAQDIAKEKFEQSDNHKWTSTGGAIKYDD
jgi:hypothetical protein